MTELERLREALGIARNALVYMCGYIPPEARYCDHAREVAERYREAARLTLERLSDLGVHELAR